MSGCKVKTICYLVILGIQIFSVGQIHGQTVEEHAPITETDTLDPEILNLSGDEWAPDPKKALWMSLIVPGLGQIYNRSWWKTPLIYGGLGTSIWFIKTNNQNYKDFKQAYTDSFDPATENELVERYPNQETLRRIRDIYYKRYQLSIIATAAVYLMNGIEAYVDAHLKNFDVSEDLSLFMISEADPRFTLPPDLSFSVKTYPLIGVRYRLH